jgi:hypothetical protein
MLAIGLIRLIIWDLHLDLFDFLRISLVPAAFASCGAAVGGLFGKMRQGAIWRVGLGPPFVCCTASINTAPQTVLYDS